MEQTNYIPQRGIDFDDFIGSKYFEAEKQIDNLQLNPVFCGANENHSDDFIGIAYKGYQTRGNGKLIEGIMYPSKNFTQEDLDRLFDKVSLEDGTVKYVPSKNLSLNQVYIRVCYKTPGKPNPATDTIKWVAAVDGGEVFALHGDRRRYQPKNAE